MLANVLRRYLPFKELGWIEKGEEFTRFTLFKCRYFSVYLHRLVAPETLRHGNCHDHPWHFWAVLLAGGYEEITARGSVWHKPGSVLYRTATFSHNVITKGVSWSVIVASKKIRGWGFKPCGHEPVHHWLLDRPTY